MGVQPPRDYAPGDSGPRVALKNGAKVWPAWVRDLLLTALVAAVGWAGNSLLNLKEAVLLINGQMSANKEQVNGRFELHGYRIDVNDRRISTLEAK